MERDSSPSLRGWIAGVVEWWSIGTVARTGIAGGRKLPASARRIGLQPLIAQVPPVRLWQPGILQVPAGQQQAPWCGLDSEAAAGVAQSEQNGARIDSAAHRPTTRRILFITLSRLSGLFVIPNK